MSHLDIAIVGMSGEFPGASNVLDFWSNLIQGRESIEALSVQQLQAAGVSETDYSKKNYVARTGMLRDIDAFDANFFGFSPREAALMDPQQRKLLEHAWLAIEDAAINPLLCDDVMGIYVGSSFNAYLLNNILSQPDIINSDDLQQVLFGNGADYLATRIAYQLNAQGPAMNIQTACSTSLVAVHEACQHLLTYQVDIAVSGGVSVSSPKGYLYSIDGMMSQDGHCRSFSKNANGTVFSSGVGAVVLMRLDDALEKGLPIYAVIRGSAVNNDGHQKVGYTAPSVVGQAEVIALAQERAAVKPSEIQYIETHGTATQLGDPIELSALQKAFGHMKPSGRCALGSVKSNIGHLDAAAGIAGLIKTTMMLAHQQMPPTLHHDEPTPAFDWGHSPFYVNTELNTFDKQDHPLNIAAVSSFGIGGTNAHVILERFSPLTASELPTVPALWIFSAKTEQSLLNQLKHFAETLETLRDVSLHSIARTLQQGRAHFRYRTAFVVNSHNDALDILTHHRYQISCCDTLKEVVKAPAVDDCDAALLQLIGKDWLAGHAIDWCAHYANHQPNMVHLPGYAFEKKRYWIEPYQASAKACPIDEWFYQPIWKPAVLSTMLDDAHRPTVLVLLAPALSSYIDWDALHAIGDIVVAYQGLDYCQKTEATYDIDTTNIEDYKKLFESLMQNGVVPSHIIHALTLTTSVIETGVEAFDAYQQDGLLSCIHLMQAWSAILQDRALKLTVLTNRLNVTSMSQQEPHKTPILAAVKVIPKEYLNVQAQLIDVDYLDLPQHRANQFNQCIQEMLKPTYSEEEILLRGVTRSIRAYVKTPVQNALRPFPGPKESHVIFITGGLGQLGLDIATYFSHLPGVKLALISRRVFPSCEKWSSIVDDSSQDETQRSIITRLQQMRSHGCDVQVFSADVGQKESLLDVMTQVELTLGRITGVIHAAGETLNGIIAMKSEVSLAESYHAKVYGSYHLCELFAEHSLKFMILCSSMNAIIGGLGQLDNTAANCMVDYLAEYYAMKMGLPIMSINWGAINIDRPLKVNVVPQFIDLSTEHKRNRMSDQEVDAVYARLLAHHFGPRLVISTLEMDDVLLNWNRVASIHDLAKEIDIATTKHVALKEEDQPSTETERWIAERWSNLLGVSAIGKQQNFFELGGHSLSAVQFMTKLYEHYGVKAHVMNLYEMPTLSEFSNYVAQLLKQKRSKVNEVEV